MVDSRLTAEATFSPVADIFDTELADAANVIGILTIMIEAAPMAILLADPMGSIVLANHATTLLFGYTIEELLGQGLEVLISQRFGANHPWGQPKFLSSTDLRRLGASRNLSGLRKNGSRFPVEVILNPLLTAGGVFTITAVVNAAEEEWTGFAPTATPCDWLIN